MTIDISTIKPGGKVSVTLVDGTKIIDSPVEESSETSYLYIAAFNIVLRYGIDKPDVDIASIDAYTPPAPEWDRPEVYAIINERGGILSRDHQAKRWPLIVTPWEYEHEFGPFDVLAVYAEGARP